LVWTVQDRRLVPRNKNVIDQGHTCIFDVYNISGRKTIIDMVISGVHLCSGKPFNNYNNRISRMGLETERKAAGTDKKGVQVVA